jgi:hypothetical protein
MAKASTIAELSDLHKLVAKSLSERISKDLEDDIPTDAATLGAAIKFLKDNAVTADPEDQEDLSELRDKLAEKARQRRVRVGNVVALASADLDVMEG